MAPLTTYALDRLFERQQTVTLDELTTEASSSAGGTRWCLIDGTTRRAEFRWAPHMFTGDNPKYGPSVATVDLGNGSSGPLGTVQVQVQEYCRQVSRELLR